MGLFGNQYKEGKGVRKNEPVKKPFFRFWEEFGRKFWNLISLNLLYILMCLPVVTIGAATAAFTYVLRNYVLGRPVFLKDDFFSAFKNNWKQGTAVFLLQVIFFAIDAFAVYFYFSVVSAIETKDMNFYIYMGGLAISLSIGIIFLFMSFYLYLMLVSFDFKMKSLIKNSFYFSGLGVKVNFINLFGILLFILVGILLISWKLVLPLGIMYFVLLTAPFCGYMVLFNVFPLVKKHVIDPYYEEQGIPNPLDPVEDEEEAVFQDDVTLRYEEEQRRAELEEKWGKRPENDQ